MRSTPITVFHFNLQIIRLLEDQHTDNSPDRILVDCHLFDGAFEGTRTYIEGLYSSVFKLEDANPSGRVYYLAARNLQSVRAVFPEKPFIKYIQLRSRRSFQRLIFEFPYLIRKYKIDYAHFQYIVPFSGKCAYILTIHDLLFLEMPQHFSWYYKSARKWLFKRSYEQAKFVFTVSHFSRESIMKFYGQGKDVKVVPLTLQERIIQFKSRYTGPEWQKKNRLRNYLLYISRFEERKNHYTLLKVYSESRLFEQYDLVLIGRKSEDCRQFDELYNRLPADVQKRVILKTEGLELDELLEFLSHSTLFVYPSLAEGFGVPPLEAAALRVPVVCSNTTAMKDFGFFGNGHTDCSSESLLLRAIQNKLQEPDELRQTQCEAIRETVLARYSGEGRAEIFLNAIFAPDKLQGLKNETYLN
jgi:glycosyltransferase involved in cell wall biosynthesis